MAIAQFLCNLMSTHTLIGPGPVPPHHLVSSSPTSSFPTSSSSSITDVLRSLQSVRHPRSIQPNDILVIAPYNSQVRVLQDTFAEVDNQRRQQLEQEQHHQPDQEVAHPFFELSRIRVGTVDRFQGQQAPIVILSMTLGATEVNNLAIETQRTMASSEELPSLSVLHSDAFSNDDASMATTSSPTSSSSRLSNRHVDFVMDRARLNVALSRSMCLVVVAASRTLLAAPATTIDQLRLASFLTNVCYGSNVVAQYDISKQNNPDQV